MKFDDIKKLHQKKYRDAFGHFLLEGEHLVLELQKALASYPLLQQSELYVTEAYADWHTSLTKHVISERQFAQLSATKTPQGIAAVVPMLPGVAPRANERAIYLHEIQDPGNLGTILRTLAWFGQFRCLLGPNSVDPYNDKAVRASMGAIFHVPIELGVPLAALSSRYERIACLDMHGSPIQAPDFKHCDCYLFGGEARGVPRESDIDPIMKKFTIPGAGAIESLNVATVVGICVYEVVATA